MGRHTRAMRLLVSVANAAEAAGALAGGADVIDAKDPAAGALGAVSLNAFCEIHTAVAGQRLVTAAIGDATDELEVERLARAFAGAGATLVKVGFAGINNASRVERLIRAAVLGVSTLPAGVVAVAYADAKSVQSLAPRLLVEAAVRAGATAVLLDTADKNGPGLSGLMGATALAAWVDAAHDAGLLVALAGQLSAGDLSFVHDAGADIAGVRGAACEGGRAGRISADRVRSLRDCVVQLNHLDVRSVRL